MKDDTAVETGEAGFDTGLRVGFPRALMYYTAFEFWKRYLAALGVQIVVSPPTDPRIMARGLDTAPDDMCLPVKVLYGHAAWLEPRVDYLVIPRVVSTRPREFSCPKFMGLPDVIRAGVRLTSLVTVKVDASQSPRRQRRRLVEFARGMGFGGRRIGAALAEAGCVYRRLPRSVSRETASSMARFEEGPDTLRVAVLGHPYLLGDDLASSYLLGRLMDCAALPLLADELPGRLLDSLLSELPEKLYWTEGAIVLAAARHYCRRDDVDGVIHAHAFGCGSDSLLGHTIGRRVRCEGDKPFMNLVLDEHSGKEGLLTRLEAFTDMLRRRRGRRGGGGG